MPKSIVQRFNLFLDEDLYWRLKKYVVHQEVTNKVRLTMAEIIRMAIVSFLDKAGG